MIRVASSDWTRRGLSVGTAVAAACFMVAVVLDMLGRGGAHGDPTDLPALAASVARLEAWGWATLGTFAIIFTPAISLVATAVEYRAVADQRTTLTALAVLGVLLVSVALALLGPRA
jgi:hypothetical protein